MSIGDSVTYYDEFGVPHQAVLTQVWGTDPKCAVNLVYVSSDSNETDQYGRQIKRECSVVHKDNQGAHGRYWN